MSDLARYATDLETAADNLHERASHAVRKAALATMADAQTLAPVDTGNLKGSITTDVAPGDLVGVVEATADYAAYVEFGHRTHSGTQVPPQPFMRPAQDRNTEPFMQALAQLVEEV